MARCGSGGLYDHPRTHRSQRDSSLAHWLSCPLESQIPHDCAQEVDVIGSLAAADVVSVYQGGPTVRATVLRDLAKARKEDMAREARGKATLGKINNTERRRLREQAQAASGAAKDAPRTLIEGSSDPIIVMSEDNKWVDTRGCCSCRKRPQQLCTAACTEWAGCLLPHCLRTLQCPAVPRACLAPPPQCVAGTSCTQWSGCASRHMLST